jgi:hypothetical protein
MWISKQEYDESGPSIVHRKCFWFRNVSFGNPIKSRTLTLSSFIICFFFLLFLFLNFTYKGLSKYVDNVAIFQISFKKFKIDTIILCKRFNSVNAWIFITIGQKELMLIKLKLIKLKSRICLHVAVATSKTKHHYNAFHRFSKLPPIYYTQNIRLFIHSLKLYLYQLNISLVTIVDYYELGCGFFTDLLC